MTEYIIDEGGGEYGFSYGVTASCSNTAVTWTATQTSANWFTWTASNGMLRVSCEEAEGEIDKSITLTPSVNGSSCSSKIIRITQRGISPCTCNNFSYLGIAAFFDVSGATSGTVVGHYTFDDDCPDSSISFNSVTYIFDETTQDYIVAPDQYDISLGASNGDITLLTDIGENEDTHVRKFIITVNYGNETCGSGYELIQDGAEEQCDCTTALNYYLTSLVRTFPYTGNTEEIIASAMTTCGEITAMANCGNFFTDPSYPVAVKSGNTILFKAQVADDPTSGGMSSCGVTFQFKGGGVTGETAIQCSRQVVLQRYDYFCRCNKITISDAFYRWTTSSYHNNYWPGDGFFYKENECSTEPFGFVFSSNSGIAYRRKYECFNLEITDIRVDGVSIPLVGTYPSGDEMCAYTSQTITSADDIYFLNTKDVTIYNSFYYFCSLDISHEYVSVDVYGYIVADGKWVKNGNEYYFEGGTKCEDGVLHLRYYRNLGYTSCTQVQSNIIVSEQYSKKVDDVTSKIEYNFTSGNIIILDGDFGCGCENSAELQIVNNGGFLESSYEEGGIGKLWIGDDGHISASVSATNTSNSARTATLKLVYPIGTTNCEKLFYVIQDYFHPEDCVDCTNYQFTTHWSNSYHITNRYSPDYPYEKIGETAYATLSYKWPYPDCVSHFNFGTPTAVTVNGCDDGSDCSWIDSSSIAFSSDTSSDGLTLYIRISADIDTYYSSSSSDNRYGYFKIAMSNDSALASCFPERTAYFRQNATAPTACTCGSLLSVQRTSNAYMNSNGEFQNIGTDNNLVNIGQFSVSNASCMNIIVSSNQSQYLNGLTYSMYSQTTSYKNYYIKAIVLPNNTGQPYNFTIDINVKLITDGSSCGGQNLTYSVLPT